MAVPGRALSSETARRAAPRIEVNAPAAQTALDEACLREAYPHTVEGLENDGDAVWLRLRDGRRVLYAETPPPPPQEDADGALHRASVSQAMAVPYPAGAPHNAPRTDDPGRNRSTDLMAALYGATTGELELEKVRIGASSVSVSSKQGMAAALRRVALRLEEALAQNPALYRYIFPLGGGQYWRPIAGTQRLSAHSFGIAVDLNPEAGAYWRWTSTPPTFYPQAIIDAFEANGFIWGGRWAHFDFMHFEYRPELLCKARRLAP